MITVVDGIYYDVAIGAAVVSWCTSSYFGRVAGMMEDPTFDTTRYIWFSTRTWGEPYHVFNICRQNPSKYLLFACHVVYFTQHYCLLWQRG